jgi:hypothetical protein
MAKMDAGKELSLMQAGHADDGTWERAEIQVSLSVGYNRKSTVMAAQQKDKQSDKSLIQII